MSFDRPGLPHPGHELDPAVEDVLREEGVELSDTDEPDVPEHPGSQSLGPQPNPPRRPPHNPQAQQSSQDTEAQQPTRGAEG
ncbi:hypothetical protein [Kribbella sp. NPDC048928]|uniref:hypothetical protein n=1 Tax=Kribbella sp. NPDC048928 TaxID=3364111 RepID=UPI00371B95D3